MLLSVICCLLSNSWLMTWISLEVNTISFCAILLFIMSKEVLHKESIMKYFIVQSVASAALLMRRAYEVEKTTCVTVWLTLAILAKMGRTPFHQWFVNVSNLLPLTGRCLLITTQKILPIFLISLIKRKVIFAFAIANILIGTISQYYTKKLLTIMALSSVANLRWLIVASQLCLGTMWTIMLIYITNVLLVLAYMRKKERSETSKKNRNSVSIMILLARLAGMPPLMTFLPKWIITKGTIESGMIVPIILLLVLSSIRMYVYMRMFTPILLSSPSRKGKIGGSKALNAIFVTTLLASTIII